MRKGEAFPSNWLGKEDVMSGSMALTITKVENGEVKSEHGSEVWPIMWFRETKKQLILKPTNWGLVESLHGPESDDWAGKTIEVFHDPTVMFGSDRVGGLRIRAPGGMAAAAPPPADEAAPVETILWEDAKSEALEAGLYEDELKIRLKQRGISALLKSPNGPVVDAAAITAIIQEQHDAIPF